MEDLEMAKERLRNGDLGLSIVKDGHVMYESASRGLFGLLDAIESERTILNGSSVADRIVGKAVALLCVYVKVKAVYAITLSREAKAVLDYHAVCNEFDGLVDVILDVDHVNMCPFEQLVEGISSPRVAYEKVRVLCQRMQREDRQ
jgi:hypothetical protein